MKKLYSIILFIIILLVPAYAYADAAGFSPAFVGVLGILILIGLVTAICAISSAVIRKIKKESKDIKNDKDNIN